MKDKERARERLRKKYDEEWKPTYDALMELYPFTTDDLDGEIWKSVPDRENYHCSNFGRVKSFQRDEIKILKPTLSFQGYLFISLWKNNKPKNFRLNVLVAKLFIPNPFNKPEVNHVYSRFSNHVDCLEWATHSENEKHAFANGLKKTGEEHGQAKLTNEQVIYIRENPDNLNLEQLAEKFGVCFQNISDIQLGKKYKNVGGKIRGKKPPGVPRVSDEKRAQILADFQPRVKGHGCTAVGKRLGVSPQTVLNIVNGRR